MEPPVRFERTTFALPRRRSFRWSYEGTSWGSVIRTRISRFQRPAGFRLPHSPPRAACRSRTRCLGGTNSVLWPDELTRRAYPAPDSNRHYRPPQGRASCLWASWVWSLWTVSNRLPPRTKGTLCQVSYRGMRCPPWSRTRNLRNQSPALCHFELMGIRCAARDSNPD
jgi:hypothetical protein